MCICESSNSGKVMWEESVNEFRRLENFLTRLWKTSLLEKPRIITLLIVPESASYPTTGSWKRCSASNLRCVAFKLERVIYSHHLSYYEFFIRTLCMYLFFLWLVHRRRSHALNYIKILLQTHKHQIKSLDHNFLTEWARMKCVVLRICVWFPNIWFYDHIYKRPTET